ncbi:MAG: hypothetical protein HDS11_02585 [Bacteroides sp.]|nr:hypothetical protein [Bacteroides sp.]
MEDKKLGCYVVKEKDKSLYINIPTSSGLKEGDKVILAIKNNGVPYINKKETNFWENVPAMTEKERKEEI